MWASAAGCMRNYLILREKVAGVPRRPRGAAGAAPTPGSTSSRSPTARRRRDASPTLRAEAFDPDAAAPSAAWASSASTSSRSSTSTASAADLCRSSPGSTRPPSPARSLVVDADTGEVVREGRAPHPDGTEVDPAAWRAGAAASRSSRPGGLDDVAAVAVGGQQHGMVCLDDAGDVVRPALLWNDNRSAAAARDLIEELGGPAAWAERSGVVPVASLTVTKLRWLADARARRRRPHGRRLPPARLAHLAARRRTASSTPWSPTAATRAAPATGRRRPARTARICSSAPSATSPACRACSGPAEVAGTPRAGARARPRAPATTPPRRSGSAPDRATWWSRSARPASPARCPRRRHADPTGMRGRFRRRHRATTCRCRDPQRRPRARRGLPAARRRPRRAVAARAVRAGRRGWAGAGALPRGRAHPAQARRDRPRSTG